MSGKWIVDAVVDALRRGKAMEREAIVAWLRSEACFKWLLHNTGGFTRDQASNLAQAIADGEHLRGDDE